MVRNKFAWGALSGALVSLVLFFAIPPAPPNPYSDVEIVDVKRISPTEIEVIANFVKNECTFMRLEVFGSSTGILEFVEWESLQGRGKEYDRSVGVQTLDILVRAPHDKYDSIEIRTRHSCGGEIVDKTFAVISGV